MKKTLKTVLCLALAVLMLSSVAFADLSAADVVSKDTDRATVVYSEGKIKVTLKSGVYTEGEYVVMVVAASDDTKAALADGTTGEALMTAVNTVVTAGKQPYAAIDENTILYIDQKTVAASGNQEFTAFLPKSIADSVVLLGGGGGAPEVLGVIKGHGVDVKGKVTSYKPTETTTIGLYATTDTNYETALFSTTVKAAEHQNTAQEQIFTISAVTAGTYNLRVTKDGNLPYIVTGVVVSGDNVDLTAATGKAYANMTLITGQMSEEAVNRENVGPSDLAVLKLMYNKRGAAITQPVADIEGDGVVQVRDLGLFKDAYNKRVTHSTFPFGA